VTVFRNLGGVRFAVKAAKQEKLQGMRRMPAQVVPDFLKDDGVVLVCGPCLAELGIKRRGSLRASSWGPPA